MDETELIDLILKVITIYDGMRPNPTQVSQTQAADMLKKSHPIVRKLVRSGVLPLNDCGQIPIEAIYRARASRKAA